MNKKLEDKKCCATCDESSQLYVGDTPSVYYFCRFKGAEPLVMYDVCEHYRNHEEESK